METLYEQVSMEGRRPVSGAQAEGRRRTTDMRQDNTDVLVQILPRANNKVISSARRIITSESDEDEDDLFSSQYSAKSRTRSMIAAPTPRLRKRNGSLEDSREAIEDHNAARETDAEPPAGEDHPAGELTPSKSSVAVPRRFSSRPKNNSSSIHHISALHDNDEKFRGAFPDYDVPLEDRHMADFDDSRTEENETLSRPLSSATPPPIGIPRGRDIYSDFDGSHQQHHRHQNSDGDKASAATVFKEDTAAQRPVSRHRSSSKEANGHAQTPPRASRAAVMRTPLFQDSDLYGEEEPGRPMSRNGPYAMPPLPKLRDHLRDQRSLPRDSHDDYMFTHSDVPPSMVGLRSKPASRRAHSDVENFEVDDVSVSRQSGMTNSSSRMPDFFGAGIFHVVLHNPTTNHQLLLFSESRLCSENVEFLSKVEQYRVILNDLATTMATIHKDFISEDSPRQITAPTGALKTVHADMKKVVLTSLPAMESIFGETQERIEQMVFTDIYPRFVRHQMTLSAIRALANDRHRYQGLGDCFCLTNPNKADNPIVFASDGFVKVTGYARPEVIPRNCRFLQGTHTDRAVVRRLREGIDARREVVELLLNYKKNGDPFWNLLYMAPLFDENGKLAFFIGGQVNCSTTIHSNADVMRILSLSNKEEPEEEIIPKVNGTGSTRSKGMSSARKAILKAFGVQFNDPTPGMIAETAGMERKVLGRMEGRDLNAQMKEFYTAYSKYIVLRYDTFVIHFYSQGLTDMLNPANVSGLVAGNDIFRFFRANMTVPQNDYKARVRNTLRMGQPLSVELRLQTSRSALFRGDESFMSHWTPLKDEKGAVAWVVVTLAPVML